MELRWVVDTNVLLEHIQVVHSLEAEYGKPVILSHVLRELEKHTISRNASLAYRARKVIRFLDANEGLFEYDLADYKFDLNDRFDAGYVDNMIIQACVVNGYGLISNDLLLIRKAKAYNIPHLKGWELAVPEDVYGGVRDVFIDMSKKEDREFYKELYAVKDEYKIGGYNPLGLVRNEYLFVWDTSKPTEFDQETGEPIAYELVRGAKHRWDGEMLAKLSFSKIKSKFMGEVEPINHKQDALFDLLQDPTITVKGCFGTFGVGKDYVMLSHAINLLERNKFDKIVWVRNNIEVKDTKELGFRKGDLFDKLIEFAMPLADHVGGVEGLKMLYDKRKIELQHLGTLRGRDIKNAIIYVTEVQNNTKDHVQLLLGRVGQGSELWLNGDIKQTDNYTFDMNSGLKSLIRLKGNMRFGLVTLDKTERSETAEMAKLLED